MAEALRLRLRAEWHLCGGVFHGQAKDETATTG